MLDLMKKLNYTKEDEPEMRLAKAKHFMEEREGQGSTNETISPTTYRGHVISPVQAE